MSSTHVDISNILDEIKRLKQQITDQALVIEQLSIPPTDPVDTAVATSTTTAVTTTNIATTANIVSVYEIDELKRRYHTEKLELERQLNLVMDIHNNKLKEHQSEFQVKLGIYIMCICALVVCNYKCLI